MGQVEEDFLVALLRSQQQFRVGAVAFGPRCWVDALVRVVFRERSPGAVARH